MGVSPSHCERAVPIEGRLRSARAVRAGRARFPGGQLVAIAAIAASLATGFTMAADAPDLPRPVKTSHRTFAIPFRPPETKDRDAVTERVVLEVSRDLGVSWSRAAETKPSAGSFTFTANDDGEFWFRLRAVDREGRSRGGEGPDIRVLVDAADPRIAARVWKGPDGEIICRYAATDVSLAADSLVLEYRGTDDRGWKSIAADAVLARESPAHLVGESIWWAGERVEKLVVRITVADASGNRSVEQFTLAAADPQVDQDALAKELGLAPLPAAESVVAAEPVTPPATADSGPPSPTAASRPDSVLVERGGDGPWPAERADWNQTPGGTRRDRAATSVAHQPTPAAVDRRPTAAGAAPQDEPAAPVRSLQPSALEYRGRPLHLAGARRFSWEYDMPEIRRSAGPLRAELWTTRDGGVTWQQAAVDADGKSPIEVELPAAGLYGVRLEIVAAVPEAEAGPRSGTEPDAWVGVDEDAPEVTIQGVARTAESDEAFLIDYAARDPLLPTDGVRLLYSPNADGPWATIAEGLASAGSHRWQPGPNVPARVFLRVEATDAAGHTGSAVTEESVTVAPTRFGGRLGGLRVTPAP